MFQKYDFDRLVEWFIKDIEDSLAWQDIDDISELRKIEIATHKAKNMLKYMNTGDAYEPFK